MENEGEMRKNIMLRSAAAMLCLVLISGWAISGVLAKYVTGGSSGDSANVAAFSVTEGAFETKSIDLLPGSGTQNDKNTFDITVTNNSEVAVKYTFTMELTGNLPLKIATANKEELTKGNDSDGNMTWSTNVAAGENSTNNYTFYPVWDSSKNSYIYSGGVESIQVTVSAEQED
jgi:hypothetical protein